MKLSGDFDMKGALFVKMKHVLKESLRLYKKNFPQLMLAMLAEAVLRLSALTPLMFLAEGQLAPLALLAIPLYLLIALPARQNYARALQDMMNGGSVFSDRLIALDGYGRKLWRGLKGTLCMLLWSIPTIAGLAGLYAGFMGAVDFVTFMSFFKKLGGSVPDGVVRALLIVAATALLIFLGCAVHSGTRHAVAMGEKKLLKGRRFGLIGLWVIGALLFVPYIAVLAYTLSDFLRTVVGSLKALDLEGISLALGARQLALIWGGAALLVLPALPLRSLLPAVYLRKVKEERDAAS